jgi:beta-glucosidase
MSKKLFLTATLFSLLQTVCTYAQNLPPYKNAALSVEERIKDLLQRMTLEEKAWQLFMIPGDLNNADSTQYKNGIFGLQVSAAGQGDAGGQLLHYNATENAFTLAQKINRIQKYFVEQTRLGIPIIAFDETLHGLVRQGATSFPQAIGLAATFNTAMMHNVANAIADETKVRGIRDVLSPVINIASDVRWGRVEETYGEDPFLTSAMVVAYVSAFEKKGIITTPKHFIANVGDGGRDSYPIHLNERLLQEIHFPPFMAAIKKGGARSIMTAYNSVDGTASSANNWLLKKKLKTDWGFTGFVISDASAVGGEVVLHNTAKDYGQSGANAINNGLDVIFQTQVQHQQLFFPAFADGRITKQNLDEAVARVVRAKFELGLFENPYVNEQQAQQWVNTKNHKALALAAARESIVLLKNEKYKTATQSLLPLSKKTKSIAVIGEEAIAARLGGYSGPGNGVVSVLEGIRQKIGATGNIVYTTGATVYAPQWTVIPAAYLFHTKEGKKKEGLQATYYSNLTHSGMPAVTRVDKQIDFLWTLSSPDKAIVADHYSARWAGELKAPKSGYINIGLDGNDGYRLYINDQLLIDQWTKNSYSTKLVKYLFEKDKRYKLKIEFYESIGNAKLKLIWDAGIATDWQKKIDTAVAVAKKADVAIIAAGIHEGEFQDRAFLSLPGHQEELINAVAATGKPVVVVITGGSAVTMSKWLYNVTAVIDAWYPGEEGGHAVADVLFGDYNPAGRLPITFPVQEAQLPLVYNHKPTGRGDDYYDLSGLPLFPFGYGLSYTSFMYDGLQMEKHVISKSDSVTVQFNVTNVGTAAGDEVVQLYIKDVLASVARPVQELKGFQRVHILPGETKRVTFTITPEMLTMLNKELQPVIEPGDFRIMIGSNSRELKLKTLITVKE